MYVHTIVHAEMNTFGARRDVLDVDMDEAAAFLLNGKQLRVIFIHLTKGYMGIAWREGQRFQV